MTPQEWKPNRDGSFKRDEPQKIRDHSNDAARYLAMGLTGPEDSSGFFFM